jgi:hypothetical protein
MLVSFATGIVVQQTMTGIELKAEVAQTSQRKTGDLRHHHRRCPILRHPARQLRQRTVRLADGQGDFVTTAIAPQNSDRLAATGMKVISDNRLTKLIVSIMSLFRRRPARSSTAGKPDHDGRCPEAFYRGR